MQHAQLYTGNQLLAALPMHTRQHILPKLKLTRLLSGQVLHEGGQPVADVYFPLDCIVSVMHVTAAGSSAEVCLIGNEGVTGTNRFLGAERTPHQAIVQSVGSAYQLPASVLCNIFDDDHTVRSLLLRYVQTLIVQMAQTAVCNRHHSIYEQLCRYLLLSLDRLPGNSIIMTQESIANMLGVRREGVTEAACKLQRSGIIRYQRGHITVLDRSMLEERCCECYSTVQNETKRILCPAPSPVYPVYPRPSTVNQLTDRP